MNVGIGVEGPSDYAFWKTILHRTHRKIKFDIRNMKNRTTLIRETPRLLESFRDAHYDAGIILIDNDDSPCITSIVREFEPSIQNEVRKKLNERFLFVCVAVRELEAWYLADELAIKKIFPDSSYKAQSETSKLNAEKIINELWRKQYSNTALNKIDLAKNIALHFNPDHALKHSASFVYFWHKMNVIVSAR